MRAVIEEWHVKLMLVETSVLAESEGCQAEGASHLAVQGPLYYSVASYALLADGLPKVCLPLPALLPQPPSPALFPPHTAHAASAARIVLSTSAASPRPTSLYCQQGSCHLLCLLSSHSLRDWVCDWI